MNQEQREQQAAKKWLGPNTISGRMYDVLKLMEALIGCYDPEILQRAMRVARHALVPIQAELQSETQKRYFDEAYPQIRAAATKSKRRDVSF